VAFRGCLAAWLRAFPVRLGDVLVSWSARVVPAG